MYNNKQPQYFLFFCLVASIIFIFFIIRPFLIPLVMAGIFALLFQPIFLRLARLTKGRQSISAFLVTILSVFIVILPIIFLGSMILKEATGLYKDLTSNNVDIVDVLEKTISNAKNFLPMLNGIELDLAKYVSQGLETFAQNIGAILSSFAKIIINSFVFLIALYFLLKDGRQFGKYLIELSPLDDKDDRFIVSRLKMAVYATVKGNLTIGLIQGALTGVGFAIFGVPNPVLWGGLAAIAALLPGIGTTLVIAPAIFYLFFNDSFYSAIGLTIWGLTAVGLIDNILGPRLVGQGMHLHPLAVFVSVLGGMAFFGPLGFIFGPLVLSICLALVDIYFSLKKSK
jgi:predicted PurR-regulated permease PerM